MANQVVVTQSGNVQVSIQPTPNVQVQVSRAAIGNITVSNVSVANTANYAHQVLDASQPNITSLGTITGLTSSGNITAPFFLGNVVGNISGNIVVPGTNTSVLFNDAGVAGASDAFQFNKTSNTVTVNGNLSATNISGNGAGLSSITGANVSGQVSYAAVANSVSGSNVSGEVSYAATANSVAGGNVSGQVAYAAVANSVAGANVSGAVNLATYATTANAVAGANVSGVVANATHATVADSANSVAGSNVSGAVAYATTANSVAGANVSGQVSYAAVANSVAVANVAGIGNISTINIDGNSGNVLYGNGIFAAVVAPTSVANANYANYAGNVTNSAQPNITSLGSLTGLTVVGDATVTGNLAVDGNLTYVNVTNLVVQDPVIEMGGGPNGAPLTTNDGRDRGSLLHYYTTQPVDAFMGWDNSNGEFGFGSNVTNSNDVMTFNNYGNVRASTFIGDLTGTASHATVSDSANSVAGANVSGAVAYATTANSVAGANVSGQVSYAAVANSVAGANVSGDVSGANHANIADVANSVSGSNVSGAVNLANYATVANSVAGANVSGEVAYAAVANSVAVANVSGIGNIATINLDGNVSNLLAGNGTWIPVPSTATANFANYAGNVTVASQPNITSVGTLTSLAVAGNITGPDVISFDTSNGTGTLSTGQLSWDTGERTLSLGMLNGVTQQIGLETYILVKASAAIADGEVVMFTGADGNNVTAAPADVTSVGFQSEYVIGVATQSLATNDFGYITVMGIVHGLNTNSYNVGDILWLSTTTPGLLVNTQPTDPNYQIQVAAVTKKSAGDGHIQVRVTPFASLTRLTDVEITTPTTGQALVYNGSNVWINGVPAYANTANSVSVANVSGIGNIAVVNLDGSSSNVLYGNGVFAPESTTGNANYAAYTGNVTISAQPNITSVGNLTSLTITDGNTSNPITRFIPSGNVIGNASQSNSFIRIDQYSDLGNANGSQNISFVKSRGTSASPSAAANNDVILRMTGYVYNGNTYPKAAQISITAPQAANANFQLANTVFTPGSIQITTGNPFGNVANTNALSGLNTLTYNQNGTLVLVTGSPLSASAPSINMITYGTAANAVGASQIITTQRARGNRDSNVAVDNNDQLGGLGWQGYNGNAFFTTRFAQIRANVNTAHGTIANGASIPTDLQFITCSNTTGYTTTLYGNGAATFPGALTVSSGNITASSGNLNVTAGNIIVNGTTASPRNFVVNNGGAIFTIDNVDTTTASFAFATYNNANSLVNPYTFYRGRGTVASPAAVQAGDTVSSIGYNVYGDSGNAYVQVATSSVNVTSNDGAGNVTATYSITSNNISLIGNVTANNMSFTKFNETVNSASISGTVTPDVATGTIFNYTLTGNVTINSLANVVAGSSATLIVTQDGTGGRTLTSSMLFAGGEKTLSTAAGAKDIISVFYDGSTYYATLSKGYA